MIILTLCFNHTTLNLFDEYDIYTIFSSTYSTKISFHIRVLRVKSLQVDLWYLMRVNAWKTWKARKAKSMKKVENHCCTSPPCLVIWCWQYSSWWLIHAWKKLPRMWNDLIAEDNRLVGFHSTTLLTFCVGAESPCRLWCHSGVAIESDLQLEPGITVRIKYI